MSFNVYKIKFIDNNDIEIEENIHSDTEKNALVKLKSEYNVSKVIAVQYIPTVQEIRKVYELK